nr:hypothetical protein [Tanacetum cinerariifolium]
MSNTNTNLQHQTSSVLHNGTLSSCSTSNVQEKTQLSKSRCMNSLREVKSQFKFLSETLQDFGTMPIFKRTFSQDLNLLEQHLTKDIFSQTNRKTILTNVRTTFENAFSLEFKEHKYFIEYTGIEVKHFRDTLLQHMGNVKKFIAERIHHQRQYDRRVNKRQMQMQESKIDTGKAVNDDLVVIESIGTESEVQDDNSRSGNDTDADDADIMPIYDEEPMAEVQLTAKCNIFAIGQQHTEQPEVINEGRVDQYPGQRQVKSPMLDSSPDNQTNDDSKQSLETENISQKYRKLFDSCTSKVDSEPPHGSNVDIPNIHEFKQTLDLESLFGPFLDEYFNGENQVVSKSCVVTTADASIKRQQQQDSTSSTSTLPTTVTADGNFDL